MSEMSVQFMAPSDSTSPPRPTSTRDASLRSPLAAQLTWIVVALLALSLNFGAMPQRLSELYTVCPTDTCANNYTQDQVDAIHDLGFTVPQWAWIFEGLSAVMTLGSLIPAAIIFWRRPNSAAAFIASLFLILVGNAATLNWGAMARVGVPALTLIFRFTDALAGIFVALLFYAFPNGRFTPRWTRWVIVGWITFRLGAALLPDSILDTDAWMVVSNVAAVLVYLGGVIAQIYRYRGATPIERQQTKWVIAAFAVQVVAFASFIFRPEEPATLYHLGSLFGYIIYVSTFMLIPIGFMFSILRYRLWDIDFLINRSLLYGVLTVVLAIVFGGSVFVLQQLFSLITGGQQSPIALGLAMLVVGLMFQPTRRVVRTFIDRRFYGIQVDYEKAIKEYIRVRKVAAAGRPTSMGEYGKLELIGHGGMGEVYRAVHPATGKSVAIKVLPAALIRKSDEYRQRFTREAEALSDLRHPNIVKLLDYGVTDDDMPYMVLEYVEGLDLDSYLTKVTKLTQPEFLKVMNDVAAAIDYAHKEGLIHRDIKPSNILLASVARQNDEPPFRAILTDFGIAKIPLATQLTVSSIIGTIDYIAPEQIEASGTIDSRADIYALGVTAFQLVTGERPYKGGSPVAVIIAHLEQPVPDPRSIVPDLPPPIAYAIMRAMAKEPGARFATAKEFVASMTQ
jgi:hypothetical protein